MVKSTIGLPPNIMLRYNDLYMKADIYRHPVFGYIIGVIGVYIPGEDTLKDIYMHEDVVLTSKDLETMYKMYYELNKGFYYVDPYLDVGNFVFHKDWFTKQPPAGYKLKGEKFFKHYENLDKRTLQEVILAISSLNCSRLCANTPNIFNEVHVSLTINESLFDKLSTFFTASDLIPLVHEEVEQDICKKEQLWRDIAMKHANKQPVIIPLSYCLSNDIVKYYIEKPNKYGIYQGKLVDSTRDANIFLSGEKDR